MGGTAQSQGKGYRCTVLIHRGQDELQTVIHSTVPGRGQAGGGEPKAAYDMLSMVHVKQTEAIHWVTQGTFLKLQSPTKLASPIYLEQGENSS